MELIKVIKKIIKKSFIRYKIGSSRNYRDLCIIREVIPEPYPEDSFDGYATPNRVPWSSAQSLWIPEDHLKQILPNQPLDWLCYGWEKCITLGTEGYNHKLPLLTVATPWKEVSRKLKEIKQYPMGKAAKKREKAARAISASEALHSEEKIHEEKVDLPSLSQTHNESEISSIEGEETVLGDDTGDVDENPLFTREEEEAMSRELTAEERLTSEWISFKDKQFEMECRGKGWLKTFDCTATYEEQQIMYKIKAAEEAEEERLSKVSQSTSSANAPEPFIAPVVVPTVVPTVVPVILPQVPAIVPLIVPANPHIKE